ncbi:PH domain-containing protein [Calidifontibacter terrae]
MAFSSKHLTQGEHVETEFRTHAKKIVGPILLIIAMIAVVIVSYIFLKDTAWPWLFLAITIVALIVAIIWAFVPIWKWRATVFVLTNRRLVTRTGIMAKSGRDIPLFRINDVQYEKGVFDRMLGCGTLIVSDASDQPPLRLRDIPHVEAIQVKLNELLFAHHDDSDEGTARRSQQDAPAPFDQQSHDANRAAQTRPVEQQPSVRQDPQGPYDQNYDTRAGQQNYDPRSGEQTDPQTRPLPRQDGNDSY